MNIPEADSVYFPRPSTAQRNLEHGESVSGAVTRHIDSDSLRDEDGNEHEDDSDRADADHLGPGADLSGDEGAAHTADHHQKPVDGGDSATDSGSIDSDSSALGGGVSEEEVHL